jgi:hypothetical protein
MEFDNGHMTTDAISQGSAKSLTMIFESQTLLKKRLSVTNYPTFPISLHLLKQILANLKPLVRFARTTQLPANLIKGSGVLDTW